MIDEQRIERAERHIVNLIAPAILRDHFQSSYEDKAGVILGLIDCVAGPLTGVLLTGGLSPREAKEAVKRVMYKAHSAVHEELAAIAEEKT